MKYTVYFVMLNNNLFSLLASFSRDDYGVALWEVAEKHRPSSVTVEANI